MPYKDPEAQRRHQREWWQRRRREWVEAHGPCALCGSRDRLEVDHVDPETKISHKVWSWSAERREAELAKCQVLCWSCHTVKCGEEGYPRVAGHGYATYKRGCRCPDCRAANAASVRSRRARNGRPSRAQVVR